jgi:hypothetical protein
MLIEITGVTSGQAPYDVFICNQANTSCFLVTGGTNIPPTLIFDTELYFPYEQVVTLKIIDLFGCQITDIVVCRAKIFQDDFGFKYMDDNNYIFQ